MGRNRAERSPTCTNQPENPYLMKKLLLFLCVCLPLGLHAANRPDSIREVLRRNPLLRGGSSTPYIYTPQRYTPAPEGFAPFRIEHLGRHGSRHHVAPHQIQALHDQLAAADSARLLTAKGRRLLGELKAYLSQMYRRYGDLTPLGSRQHREIARRMYENFPEVLAGEGSVEAISTLIPRSAASMSAFVGQLKECNPRLSIRTEISRAFDPQLRFNLDPTYRSFLYGPVWRAQYDAHAEKHIDPTRFMASLLKKGGDAKIADPRQFMIGLYSLAVSLPNTDFEWSFYDYFTEEEQFTLWRQGNLREYLLKMNSAVGDDLPVIMAKPLVRQMLDSAQAAVDGDAAGAFLRFGHGEDTMPLSIILEIEGKQVREPDPDKIYLAWQDFDGNPMAGNIQWILYRNAAGRVLVKVLFNEREVALPLTSVSGPYYDWQEFERYYRAKIDRMPDLPPLPEVETGY